MSLINLLLGYALRVSEFIATFLGTTPDVGNCMALFTVVAMFLGIGIKSKSFISITSYIVAIVVLIAASYLLLTRVIWPEPQPITSPQGQITTTATANTIRSRCNQWCEYFNNDNFDDLAYLHSRTSLIESRRINRLSIGKWAKGLKATMPRYSFCDCKFHAFDNGNKYTIIEFSLGDSTKQYLLYKQSWHSNQDGQFLIESVNKVHTEFLDIN